MTFSSLSFIFFFLPVLLAVYFVVPKRWKNTVLILFSLAFYSYGEPVYVLIMLLSTAVDYSSGRGIGWARARGKSPKPFLILSLVVNLGLLGVFKYGDFAVTNVNRLIGGSIPLLGLSLPIGISFYTFQTMSYTIDVYRDKVDVQRNFWDLLLYTTLFPQLVAGPIVRYAAISQQIRGRKETWDGFSRGLCRFVCGLAKKMLLANSLAQVADFVFSQSVAHTAVLTAWLGIVAYTFQIYFDFSGYSDMAIGLGRMFGFTFEENFRYPYVSSSVSEFWRRWHISMGSWFRDYVYFPLGGSRCSRGRNVFNLLVVWTLTGLWHGASWNFVAWGLYFFVFLALEKLLGWDRRTYSLPRNLLTMLLVTLGFVLFRADDLAYAGAYLGNLFGLSGTPLTDYNTAYYFWQKWDVYLLAAVCAAPVYPFLRRKLAGHPRLTAAAGVVTTVACVAAFGLCVVFLVNDSYNPFIYFRF